MDAAAAFDFMDGLPCLVQQTAQRECIMDAMGPVDAGPPPLCFTDRIPARVAVPDVQEARLLTEQDIEEMRANREVARRKARALHANRIFTSVMADDAMREMRELGEVDDETRRRIMDVKTEKRRLRAFWAFLEQCVDKNNLPVDVACVV